jgi:hypothetical protein
VSVTYSSRRLSALVTEKYYACSNLACGHNFVVSIGVVRSLVASMTPNAEVHIPMCQRRANDIVVAPPSSPGDAARRSTPLPSGSHDSASVDHARGVHH